MEGTTIKLWKQTSKMGKPYLTGPMTNVTRLIVMANFKKEDPEDPDFLAYIVPNRGLAQIGSHVDEL